MMRNNNVDLETAVDIYCETKERAGISKEKMISYLPACIIKGKFYQTAIELLNELNMSKGTVTTYKNRHGYMGILETLQSMQKETKEYYIVGGKARTYNELLQMEYTSGSYKKVPK